MRKKREKFSVLQTLPLLSLELSCCGKILGKLLRGKNDGMSNFFLSTPTSLQVLSLSNICTTAVYLDENRNENILYLSLFPKAQWRFVYSFSQTRRLLSFQNVLLCPSTWQKPLDFV